MPAAEEALGGTRTESAKSEAGTAPAVRRAGALPATAGDPGGLLAPGGAVRARRGNPVPTAPVLTGDDEQEQEHAPAPARARSTGAAAPVATGAVAEELPEGAAETRGEGSGEAEGDVETASASSAAILSAPAGPPGDASEGPSPSNRPNKPMLAAAALVGVVLLAVPLLLTAGDKDKTDTRRHVPQDAVLAGGGTAETTGAYVPDQADDGSKSATAQQKDSGRHTQAKQKKGDEPDSPVQGTERGGNHPSGDGSTGVHGETARPENKTTQKTARTSAQTSAKVEKTASAPTWEKTARQFSNGHSGMCLSRIGPGRFVGESGCGSDTWKRLVLGTGYVLIKHVQSDMCLDTDENELYVSPCTDKDPGQRWRTPSAGGCTVYLQSIGNRYLTGWNTNTASMRLKDDADDPAKQKWRVSPSVSNGC